MNDNAVMIPSKLQLDKLMYSCTISYGMIRCETAMTININNEKQGKYMNFMFLLVNALFNSYSKASATTNEIGMSINQINVLLIS